VALFVLAIICQFCKLACARLEATEKTKKRVIVALFNSGTLPSAASRRQGQAGLRGALTQK